MRYIVLLYICAVLLLIPHAVGAARATGGVVPSTVPLFPTPVGVEANVSGNIQHDGESVFSDPAKMEGGSSEEARVVADSAQGENRKAGPLSAEGVSVKGLGGVVSVLLLILIGGVVWWAVRRKRT